MSQQALYWIDGKWQSLEVDNADNLDGKDSLDFSLIGHKHFKSEITDLPVNATTSQDGFMSASDKTKLNGIAVNANNYSHPSTHAASMITGLSTVATSGSYNDLLNKPSSFPANGGDATTLKGRDICLELDNLKIYVSDGKQVVATAITGKGISASSSDSFADLGSKINQIKLSSGSATASQVLSGYTFSNGSSVGLSGSMTNRGAVSSTLSTNGSSYTIPAGYHNGSGKVTASITNLSADNIKAGVNVGGVTGTYNGNMYTHSSISFSISCNYNSSTSPLLSISGTTPYLRKGILYKVTFNNLNVSPVSSTLALSFTSNRCSGVSLLGSSILTSGTVNNSTAVTYFILSSIGDYSQISFVDAFSLDYYGSISSNVILEQVYAV